MAIQNKNIFITGGAGFIGSTLAGRLADYNKITLFDNLTRNTIQHTDLAKHPNISLIQGDILDPVSILNAIKGSDIVVHAAAIAGIDTVIKSPVKTMEVNMLGTANVLRAAQQEGVRDRVIEFSTSEIFGSMAYRVSEESHATAGSAGEARWVYAVSKLAGEHLTHAYYREYNLPTVTLRPFNIYGPGMMPRDYRVLPNFATALYRKEPLRVYGHGRQTRTFCYITDALIGFLKVLIETEKPDVYNVGNPEPELDMATLARLFSEISKSNEGFELVKYPSSYPEDEPNRRCPNINKISTELGYKPRVNLNDGLARFISWSQANYTHELTN